MNRKLLNDIRKNMVRRGLLLQHRMLDDSMSKPESLCEKFPRRSSRFSRTYSDKHYINKLKELSKTSKID